MVLIPFFFYFFASALRPVYSLIKAISAIAQSTRDQASEVSEVDNALRQMDRSTQQNAAMVEEASAASATLADEARQLKQMIGAFQLRWEDVERVRLVS